MLVWSGSLPADERPALRPLLPLPQLPAADRQRLRRQRPDRGRPRRVHGRAAARRGAARRRIDAGDLALSELPGRPLQHLHLPHRLLRSGRTPPRARQRLARRPHLHPLEAALGDPAESGAGLRRLLRPGRALARGEPRARPRTASLASAAMVIALALLAAAAFGAGDPYLGSGHVWGLGWPTDVSLLSAPWLVLAFVAGPTQPDPRRAALLGLGCTAAALVGYFLMTDSPAEGAHYTLANARGFFVSEHLVFLGAGFTGPLFGWFGQQWRTRRAIAGALVTAAALCLEPLARKASVDPIRFRAVWLAEVAVGLAFAAAVLVSRHART